VPYAEIVSEVRALLSSESGIGWSLVRCAERQEPRFELLGPAGPVFVAVAGLQVSGWRCSGCGRLTWGYWIDGFSIHSFIAASDLPRPLPGIFTVGRPPEVHLCATGERWRRLVGKAVRALSAMRWVWFPDREVVSASRLADV
jgi:hypothetical protein